jgi:1,4-dihydroxy-2-naphthoyl-CoA hydrolase
MADPSPPDAAPFINAMHAGTWAGGLGLHVLTATRDQVVAELQVGPAHLQPQGIVHGGVHASVIESLCSVGAALDAQAHGRTVVGLENSTSFVRPARVGTLRATATPITRGRRTQVWETTIRDGQGAIVATGRVRLLVLEPDADVAGSKLQSRMGD